ncbi:hypothetical protein QEZ40_000128 [Streptomyces katrae]|uniref:Uncharacterized protein n=1 Tax=Streptomyces katrae TaxID=68223 RepID=A0ABT7GKZ7_9ACTN|nr:hypothetical protein [Streptomyces katrae]MDK9494258.1 hypothetical protein [Streptomyces katrae]
MTVFRCAGCRTALTAELDEVPLPREGPLPYEAEVEGECPPRIPPGRFAYDPGPSAFSKVPHPTLKSHLAPGGPTGSIVIGPGDVRGMTPTTDPGTRGGCCGPDGLGGANMLCTGCSAALAIESADCWTVRQVVLDPRQVVADPPAP